MCWVIAGLGPGPGRRDTPAGGRGTTPRSSAVSTDIVNATDAAAPASTDRIRSPRQYCTQVLFCADCCPINWISVSQAVCTMYFVIKVKRRDNMKCRMTRDMRTVWWVWLTWAVNDWDWTGRSPGWLDCSCSSSSSRPPWRTGRPDLPGLSEQKTNCSTNATVLLGIFISPV